MKIYGKLNLLPSCKDYLLKEVVELKNKIRDLREQFGFTQQDLSEKVHVSRQTIISLENGKYNPSIVLAYNIAKTFNMTIEEVFIFEEEL